MNRTCIKKNSLINKSSDLHIRNKSYSNGILKLNNHAKSFDMQRNIRKDLEE